MSSDRPKIRRAVIPAAGFGTRMLPITKTIPKEMLPLVDKPIIQVVVEELVAAGIKDIAIVTMSHKEELADYFDGVSNCLSNHLTKAGKQAVLSELHELQDLADITFIQQEGEYGTGTPVLCAEKYLDGEPFIYTFADDFFISTKNSFSQMIDVYDEYNAPVVGCQRRTDEQDFDKFGYVDGIKQQDPAVLKLNGPMVEHPGKAAAPSELASLGGFVVTPEVIEYLHQVKRRLSPGHELYFHSALSAMIAEGKTVMAKEITNAEYFDTGNKLEYMKTAVTLAARHPEIGAEFRQFLQNMKTKG